MISDATVEAGPLPIFLGHCKNQFRVTMRMSILVPICLFILFVMQPMGILSVGDMVVSVLVPIFIAPCLFCAVEEWKWKRAQPLAGTPNLSLQPQAS